MQNGALEYFWKRFLRIFPAFWVCLLAIVFGFGVIGWFHSNPGRADCGLSCYFREPDGPVSYVYRNFFLYIGQGGISNTLRGSPLYGLWNGSIWTLWWEFLCYVVLAAAAFGGLLRRRWPVLAATVLLWGIYAVVVGYPGWNSQVNAFHFANWMSVLRLFPVFLLGSCIYLYRDKIPDSGLLAAISSAVFLVSFAVPIGNDVPSYWLTSTDLAGVFLVYPMIWLGMHLPFRGVGSKNDYSYGIYIYGFPTQQLLTIFGVVSWGYFAFSVLGVLCTVPLAVLSWWLIEKQALRLKDAHFELPIRRWRFLAADAWRTVLLALGVTVAVLFLGQALVSRLVPQPRAPAVAATTGPTSSSVHSTPPPLRTAPPPSPVVQPPPTTQPPATHVYVVQPGDTLWALAARYLGYPLRYQELFALNRGISQADGHTLVDPNLIYPGMTLLFPADATGIPTSSVTSAPAPQATRPPIGGGGPFTTSGSSP